MAIGDILDKFEKAQEAAATANQKRYEQALAIYDEIINRYGPGGTFMAGAEAELEKRKERDVAAEMAHSISTGMYGTTRPGTAGRRWEAEIGAPSRLKLEDIRMERLSQAQVGKAGAIERVEDVYPDYAMMAQLVSQVGNVAGVGRSSYTVGPMVRGFEDWGGDRLTKKEPRPYEAPTVKSTEEAWYKPTGLGGSGVGERVKPGTEGALPASAFKERLKKAQAWISKPPRMW